MRGTDVSALRMAHNASDIWVVVAVAADTDDAEQAESEGVVGKGAYTLSTTRCALCFPESTDGCNSEE